VRLVIGILRRWSGDWPGRDDRGIGGEILSTLGYNDMGVFVFIMVACRNG